MKTVQQLRSELCEVFDGLRDGTIAPKDAKEINNAAGKIIASVKVQLEYSQLRDEKPEIEFLNLTE